MTWLGQRGQGKVCQKLAEPWLRRFLEKKHADPLAKRDRRIVDVEMHPVHPSPLDLSASTLAGGQFRTSINGEDDSKINLRTIDPVWICLIDNGQNVYSNIQQQGVSSSLSLVRSGLKALYRRALARKEPGAPRHFQG